MEKTYSIYNFYNEEIDWEHVPILNIEEFPWYIRGEKQLTRVQCAIKQEILQMKIHSEDKYIRADACKNNEPVYQDSCFECFVTPSNKRGEAYFNIEISCNGTIYMAYRDNTNDKIMASDEILEQIEIVSVIHPTYWKLHVRIPLKSLEMMSSTKVDRETWYGNFYRCGGKEDDQYACWQALQAEKPNFHLPSQFGKLEICEYK